MNRSKRTQTNRGFALIASLLLMVLLTVVAVGLLTLSSISLRSTSTEQARKSAESNARMAVMLALGELQKSLGVDRRVTANASILGTVARPQMVGVWESATSDLLSQPTAASATMPDYNKWKTDRFEGWMISSTDWEATRTIDFAKSAATGNNVDLFEDALDGFTLEAGKVVVGNAGTGNETSMAWAVVQEGDKAHISQPGETYQEKNDVLQAPKRPNLALSGFASQPEEGWNQRAARVLSLNQAALDPGFNIDRESVSKLSPDYTVWSRGVLADVVNGGLKTDLNLAFELPDSTFAKNTWDGLPNPFRSGGAEIPIHGQVGTGAPITTRTSYDSVTIQQRFPVGAAPTYDMLRSNYAAYSHLYLSNGTTTAFERPQVNKSWSKSMGSIYPAPRGSETSMTPVLDRMMYVLSLWADSAGTPWLVITPIITLWNPYNIAIESNGYVAYPWMDIPMWLDFTIKSETDTGTITKEQKGIYLSHLIGSGKAKPGEGRQLDPYFFCNITGSGSTPSSTPVRLEPGEIRIFIPSDTSPRLYDRKAAASARVWNMKPVDDINQLKLGGGVGVDTTKGMVAGPASKVLAGETLGCRFYFQPDIFHYFTTLEDSAKLANPNVKGTVINEVQLYKGSPNVDFSSTTYTHFSGAKPQIVGVLETYHRTALQPGQQADIVQSVNTRQRYINSEVSGSSFLAGPNYNSSLRQGTTLAGLGLETTPDGKRGYYGATNSANTGRDTVVLFDVPRQPPLSMASFQNADLADTAFSPSNQFGNSWASPYLKRASVGRVVTHLTTGNKEKINPGGLGVYDHSWLLNEAMWDRFFLSSIAPQVQQKSGTGSPGIYNARTVTETRRIDEIISEWVDDPAANPLRNSHMSLHAGGVPKQEIKTKLQGESGSLRAAEHMMADGAFNVNSTNVAAWRAMLASLRGGTFDTLGATGALKAYDSGNATPVPRFSLPSGQAGDTWNGFRELTDSQIEALAEEIVVEVKARGPFQSLAEFVNRRVEDSELGLKGALQAAIDRSGLNDHVKLSTFDTTKFYAQENLPDPQTTTGLAGWLTQADLLGPMASLITVRSDTFRIRGYGEVKDRSGKVIARATCEAVVQRLPDWIDPADKAADKPDDLTSVANQNFGRRFEVVSFRILSSGEISAS